MSEIQNSKQFDLEGRTFEYARRVRAFLKTLPRTLSNIEDGKQLVKSSGSVGANYIEANEALSKKDFRLRVRISRKEAKESRYWLRLLDVGDKPGVARERDALVQESIELLRILSSILQKTE